MAEEKKKINVYDITIEEENLAKESADPKTPIGKLAQWIDKYNVNLASFLPSKTKHFVKFKLDGVHPAFANAIRRGYVSEYKCLSMICDYTKDITSDDEFLLVDFVSKCIEGIPFQQDKIPELEYMQKNWQISIDVTNETSAKIWVYSRDIKIYDKLKKVEIENMFEGTIRLTQLNTNKFIKAHISLAVGTGETNANKFKPCGYWIYEDLDRGKQHILSYEPSRFQLGYKTYGNFAEPRNLMRSICSDIIQRINKIKEVIETFEDVEYPGNLITDTINVKYMGQYHKYYFVGETIGIANLFRDYLVSECSFTNSDKDHPSNDSVFVKLAAPHPHRLLIKISKKITHDFEFVLSKF